MNKVLNATMVDQWRDQKLLKYDVVPFLSSGLKHSVENAGTITQMLVKPKAVHAHHEWVTGQARTSHGLTEGRHGGLVRTVDCERGALG